MADIYTKVKHADYLNLIKRCESLEKENAKLKSDLKKAIAYKKDTTEKVEETKKGGNK